MSTGFYDDDGVLVAHRAGGSIKIRMPKSTAAFAQDQPLVSDYGDRCTLASIIAETPEFALMYLDGDGL